MAVLAETVRFGDIGLFIEIMVSIVELGCNACVLWVTQIYRYGFNS